MISLYLNNYPVLFRNFVVVLLMTIVSSATAQHYTKNDHPNVVLIMADDLGWGDVGFNGNKIIKTPYLDQMAKDGIQFNRFYSASAVCSPTRASVLTGRNPYRTGVFFANEGILREEEVTLPELLAEQGYETGHFGKWHLGTLTCTEKDANRGKPGNMKEYNPPGKHGYNEAFVTESKVPTWDPMKMPKDKKKQKGNGWKSIEQGEAFAHFGTHYWDINGNKVADNLNGDDSRVIMDRVLPFINKSVEQEKPFLAVIWFHTPHKPCVAGPGYRAMYKGHDPQFQNYAGCITAMDEQVGRLRTYLKKLGCDKNTMIWFCSDNGPENGVGETGGFKNRKRSLYEGGVRVPGIMVWPKVVKSHVVTNYPAVTSDYLPTIVDVLGINKEKVPYALDGKSLLPLIKGEESQRKEPIVFCIKNQASICTDSLKLYIKGETCQLYKIVKDSLETRPLKDTANVLHLKREMQAKINAFRESFEGEEYGGKSYNKLQQKWHEPLKQQLAN
ncbi:MAG: sulfatase-like hydrolase/transferase [Carboxylicivirga sp.]|nr:sulfatase-like hydrolase/transferase [Carboxylicivirga sp.]